jgi:hypothetical protein
MSLVAQFHRRPFGSRTSAQRWRSLQRRRSRPRLPHRLAVPAAALAVALITIAALFLAGGDLSSGRRAN